MYKTIKVLILLALITPCLAQAQGGALNIVTASLPTATVNNPYYAPIQASGGSPPYTWSVVSGTMRPALPPGITVQAILQTGKSGIGGTTTTSGAFPFYLVVNDRSNHMAKKLMTLLVQGQQLGNFTVSLSTNSLTVQRGSQGNVILSTAISGGFNSPVALSASGLPTGATVSFSLNPLPAPGAGHSTATITVGSGTPLGSFPVTMTGNGGGKQASTTLTLTVTAAGGGGGGGKPVPTPPQVYINTTWNPPSGRTWNAHTAADFQNYLQSSVPGDTIVLDAGATYSGNFTLPLKDNPQGKWVYIESSALSLLPAPGTRVAPGNALDMPKITTPNVSPAFTLTPGANHYRLVGLQIESDSTQGGNSHNNPPSNNFTWCLICYVPGIGIELPDSITIDRSYIHGSPTQDVGQGVQANGSNFAVIDSYISDIHESTFDSQAVLAYWTPGPIKITNNYLSSTTEDVMFGGAGDYSNPYVPSDIEIRNNYLGKNLGWDSCGVGGTVPNGMLLANGTACHVNQQWIEKNDLELKSARRVVVTGNTMQYSWPSGQVGFAMDITVRTSQSGNIAVVDDVLVENNILQDVDSGFFLIGQDGQCGPLMGYPNCTNKGEEKRILIDNNLILLRPSPDTDRHTWLSLDGGNTYQGITTIGVTDVVVQHNTALLSNGSEMWYYVFAMPQLSWGCAPPNGFSATHDVWILDNAFTRQPSGDCGFQGNTALQWYMGDPSPVSPRFVGNVMFVPSGDSVRTWPTCDLATTTPFVYDGQHQLITPEYSSCTTDGKQAGWEVPQ